ncbi:hypothetical protein V6N11_077575 [Hibiscus sabdariffa]
MLGTFMVIGDSILAPSISGMIAGIAVVTLVFLFNFQRFGTSKVGYTFAPILSTTGGKTLFADVGNFSVRSIQIMAAVIAIQAMISGTFSIVQRSLSLGCFPRVKVVHTSADHKGQVYIPEVNYFLMLACVAVTFGFKTTEKIGNAYDVLEEAFEETLITRLKELIQEETELQIQLVFANLKVAEKGSETELQMQLVSANLKRLLRRH